MNWFETYWKFLGAPVSKLIGFISDKIPFSTTEVLLQLCLFMSLCFVLSFKIKKLKDYKKITLPFIGILIILTCSQGITPIDFIPSAFRTSPRQTNQNLLLSHEEIKNLLEKYHQHFFLNFPENEYLKWNGEDDLGSANRLANRVIEHLGYEPGRNVKNVKPMIGLTKILGLSYGGPAFHDAITKEIVIASYKDLPSSKIWRRMTLIHECIHAKGFHNELDTEILTYFSLKMSENKIDQWIATLILLNKARFKVSYPEILLDEFKKIRVDREKTENKQWLISSLKKIFKRINLRNKSEKYGQQSLKEKDYSVNIFLQTALTKPII